MKKDITNVSSSGIIFNRKNPEQIFIEIKDDGHPTKLVRRQLCPIGGNWIGDGAKNDSGPLDTFRREVGEELSFERPLQTSLELVQMGMADMEIFAPRPSTLVVPERADTQTLDYLKNVICENAVPFGMHFCEITKTALDSADPENKKDGFTALSCYWFVPLSKNDWEDLVALQQKFGNLSNESITMIISMTEIIASQTKFAFGHDLALQEFWLSMGLSQARMLPVVRGVNSYYAGRIPPTYEDLIEQFNIAKKPR